MKRDRREEELAKRHVMAQAIRREMHEPLNANALSGSERAEIRERVRTGKCQQGWWATRRSAGRFT